MTTFTVYIYRPDQYWRQVEVVRNDTGAVMTSHYGPGMTHERAIEIAHDEVRLHTSINGERMPNIVDHWNADRPDTELTDWEELAEAVWEYGGMVQNGEVR